jgi:hypothetical protein
MKGRDLWGDLGVDGRVRRRRRRRIRGKECEKLDWINVAQELILWRVLVNTIIIFRFYERWGIS